MSEFGFGSSIYSVTWPLVPASYHNSSDNFNLAVQGKHVNRRVVYSAGVSF